MSEENHPSGLSPSEVWYRYQRYPPLLAKLATYGLAIGLLYTVFSAAEAALVPVFLSLFIAYLLDPLVDRFEARGISRTSAILGILVAGLATIGAFVLFLYPSVTHMVRRLTEGFPGLMDQIENELMPWVEMTSGVTMPESFAAAFETYGATLRDQLPTAGTVSKWFGSVWTQVGTVLASAVNLVMIPFFTFYFLRDFDRMRWATVDYFPLKDRDFYLERIARMDEVVGAWFRGQVQVAMILAGLYSIGLGVVFGWAGIGVGAGVAIGLMAGLLNVIPYFGFLVGILAALAMVVLDWQGIFPVVGVITVFAVVQGLEGYVITPRIVGEKVGLSTVTVIIALLIGGELMGLLGILLALPIAGIIRVLWPDAVAYYRSTSLFRGENDPNLASIGVIGVIQRAEEEARAKSAAVSPDNPEASATS